jgi:protein SCO1/2
MASRVASLLARAALVGGLFSASFAAADPMPALERADTSAELPKQLEHVEVKEHLGSSVPKALAFKDELGRPVALGQYFDGKLPVVLTFNYSNCPMLCSLMLNGFVAGLKQLDYTPGKEFRVVTVSIDHTETPDKALKTQHRYLAQYERPEAKDGWHFLTGSEQNVRAYADALGFGFAWVPERKEYAHPSAMAVASPDGKIVRYLYGIEYPKENLKLALLEASEGKIGNPLERLILYCFHYDSSTGRYAPVAANVMRVGAAFSVAVLAGLLALLFRADRRRKLRAARPAEGVS